MKRILMLLTIAATLAVMMVVTAAPAFAVTPGLRGVTTAIEEQPFRPSFTELSALSLDFGAGELPPDVHCFAAVPGTPGCLT